MSLYNGIFQIYLQSGCLAIAVNVHITFSQFTLTSSVPVPQSLSRSLAQSLTRSLTQNLSTQALLSTECRSTVLLPIPKFQPGNQCDGS